VHDREML